MQFDQLKCFMEVAETNSFSKAAERLFMSQQAISKNVKNLEEELGCELFFRTKKGVMLTLGGEQVLSFAQQFFGAEKALTEKLGNIQQAMLPENAVVELRIASTSPIINTALPAIYKRVETKGNISTLIKLYDIYDSDTFLQKVYEQEVDYGLITSYEGFLQQKIASYHGELGMFVIAQDKLVAVVSRNFYGIATECNDIRTYMAERPLNVYNILPETNLSKLLNSNVISYSNDETFHRNMMKELGAVTIMPEIVYQQKFSSKRYASMELNTQQNTDNIVHAIIYRDVESQIDAFFYMFRKELYAK